jgi:hypothetical protein
MAESNENNEHLRAGIGARLVSRDAKRMKTARSARATAMAGSAGAEIDWFVVADGSEPASEVVGGATARALITELSLFRRTGIVAGRSFGMG